MENVTPTAAEFAAWRETHPPMAGGEPTLTEQIEALTAKADEALRPAKSRRLKPVEEVKALVNDEIKPEIDRIKAERADAERTAQMTALTEAFGTLQGQVETLKQPMGDFSLGNGSWETSEDGEVKDIYEREGKSLFADVVLARKRHPGSARPPNSTAGAARRARLSRPTCT
jgi:hypothetical protein